MSKSIEIEKSKKGLPCLWEKGGATTNRGTATIICDNNGDKLSPIYIRRGGNLSGGEHALIRIRKGYHVILSSQSRGDFVIKVYRINDMIKNQAQLDLKHEFSMGEWDIEPPKKLEGAIEASKRKANAYHCRYPIFIKDKS